MKLIILPLLLLSIISYGQLTSVDATQGKIDITSTIPVKTAPKASIPGKVIIDKTKRWRLDGNRILTGVLLFTSGAAKGFNETLQFNWKGFHEVFPKANPQWFWPSYSFKNKYKDGDPAKGAKFPLSTSLLVMLTDQYHLNNFIQRASMTAALVIKIGEGKKPFRHYVFDAIYYTACYQFGFGSVYYPFKSRM